MNLLPFALATLRPSVSYILLRTAPWSTAYYFSVPLIFFIHPMLIVINLLILMAFFYRFFVLCSELYMVSPDMLMVSTGLVNKTVQWIDPLTVKEFNVHQTKLMRFLNVSHVTITADDDSSTRITLKGIKLQNFTDALWQTIEILKLRQEQFKLIGKLTDLAGSLNESHGK